MDRDFKTLAIVVKRENTGGRNAVLSLLTPDSGIISVTAYGSGRGASSCRSPLYGEGIFSLERKGASSFILKDTEIVSEHEWVKDSVEKIGWVSLFSELVVRGRLADGELYRLYTSSLDSITDDNIDPVAVYFLTHYLILQGLSGDWKVCPMCLKKYEDDEILGFSTITNSAVCSSCDTLSGTLILPPNARRYVMRVSSSDISQALSFTIRRETAGRISRYLMRSLRFIFPVRLCSLESGLIS